MMLKCRLSHPLRPVKTIRIPCSLSIATKTINIQFSLSQATTNSMLLLVHQSLLLVLPSMGLVYGLPQSLTKPQIYGPYRYVYCVVDQQEIAATLSSGKPSTSNEPAWLAWHDCTTEKSPLKQLAAGVANPCNRKIVTSNDQVFTWTANKCSNVDTYWTGKTGGNPFLIDKQVGVGGYGGQSLGIHAQPA